MNKAGMSKKGAFITVALVLGICLLFVVPSMFITVIDAGEVGVQNTFGNVSDKPLYSGIKFKNPFASIVKFSIRTEEYTMSIDNNEGRVEGDDSIEARAADGASVWLDITVFYNLKPEEAPRVYKEIGVDYEEKIIRPEIRSTIREVVAQYRVNEIYSTKRNEVNSKIVDSLKTDLEKRGIVVQDALLRNVSLSDTLAKSIEEKLTAEQESQKFEFILETEKKEAERKLIEARGQRDAQALINQSLSDRYLYYLYIQNLTELNGTIYVPTEGGVPLFKTIK